MKGKGLFNYNSMGSMIKTMISSPDSNHFEIDFGRSEYREKTASLREAAEQVGIYIGTVPEGNNERIEGSNFARVLPAEFNSATAGNAMKWGKLLKDKRIGQYEFTKADRIADYVVGKGCRMRGHVLIWGRTPDGGYPAEIDRIIKKSPTPAEDVRAIMKDHIGVMMHHFKGRVTNWDVINEPMEVFGPKLANYSFYRLLGTDYIKDSFRFAREADSTAELFLNEQFFHYRDRRAKNFLNLVREMKNEDIPIDGIGLQHHIMYNEQSIEDFEWFLNQLAEMNLKVEVTELDIREPVFKKSADSQLSQAESYYKIARSCIKSGICTGITIWGVDDGHNWYDHTPPFNGKTKGKNNPLLFNGNLEKKPAYYGFRQAFLE